MIENSREQGEYLLEGMKSIEKPFIQDLRGRGLMIGLE
jgi:4-aminobutyrate aminotransferase-like enzyme